MPSNHVDLWGLEKYETHGRNKYFLSNIDDYSRYDWTFQLKPKDDAFLKFKEWKLFEKKQIGKAVKILRTDNMLNFVILSLNHTVESGIVTHRIIRATLQKNGVVERMNRTMLERVRSLMITSNIQRDSGKKLLRLVLILLMEA